MEVTSKRTPSRCREWERQRRNKFNDAITKLGEVVKSINKLKDSSGKDIDNVQYPKIEIIQKATLCLNDCVLEQTQLKAEILALQVKLDNAKEKKTYKDASSQIYIEVSKQDVSTQVFIKMKKKNKNAKCVKVMMLQKNVNQIIKNKPITTVEKRNSPVQITKTQDIKQPKLLPKIKLTHSKGPESTIVVLPASPYIFPQRPLLFPSVPPALVLVNPNLPSTNKPSASVVNRNNQEITKTTMVNILPISAYSQPLSAAKSKKNRIKSKNDIAKKTVKKIKPVERNLNETLAKKSMVDTKIKDDSCQSKLLNDQENEKQLKEPQSEIVPCTIDNTMSTTVLPESIDKETVPVKINTDSAKEALNAKLNDTQVVGSLNSKESTEDIKSNTTTPLTLGKSSDTVINKENDRNSKNFPEKENESREKDRESKLPNILETSLCDAAVEGGNARLELAEEFLAASPTAAFLMSFPLVSGNRADSPAEDPQGSVNASTTTTTKGNINQRRNEHTPQSNSYFEKPNEEKLKSATKLPSLDTSNKQGERHKCIDEIGNKETQPKSSNTAITTNVSGDNPFINLPIISTNYTSDTTYGLEIECNVNKTMSSQAMNNVSSNNLFYKGDPFGPVKNNIYSTSGINSTHDFNSLGFYPCAMEKYSSKNKSDYSSLEDNLMKMGPSRLTYDIDLGWSHKSFDFVNCTTTTSTFCKDILTTVSAPYSTAYNPFNPEFHVPLVSNSNKKDNLTKSAPFVESISSLYSQPSNPWTDDVPFYASNSLTKNISSKPQHYTNLDQNMQNNVHIKHDTKSFNNNKQGTETVLNTVSKPVNMNSEVQMPEKFPKKSSKMHINWMTSEIRSMQNMNIPVHSENKEIHKSSYTQLDYKTYGHTDSVNKKLDQTDNYFPINMHNYPSHTTQEDFHIWPSTRPLGTTEVTIEPPPINLPTLVGDLALGPHDKKKNADVANRLLPQSDVQNCGNFLSVTQLMNRSTDSMQNRYQVPNIETTKIISTKENSSNFASDTNRKLVPSRVGNNLAQPSYIFNDPKLVNNYDANFTQFPQPKIKPINKSEKSSKAQKNNYSAEALIRGANCSQKMQESNSSKFIMGSQKYNEYTTAQESVAQVSHFPAILDYSDNTYVGQQFSGTTLYNTTTNTISNSFYTNFMPGNSNLMSSNYAGGTFTSDFIDYGQTAECNYSNHKYEEPRMRSNPTVFHQEKIPSNYKSSRKESGAKHKLECSKKESSKKYQSKKAKLNTEVEEWPDTSHLLWQNKSSYKRHPNLTSEELPFTNYVNNQMPTQYQPELFNSHLMPSNMQNVGQNVDRSLATFPGTSRANFNLSSIFPEITMKVQ